MTDNVRIAVITAELLVRWNSRTVITAMWLEQPDRYNSGVVGTAVSL